MGGIVWVESKLGEGSTFTFVLPRKPPERSSNVVSEPEA
jgi:signal transduction histidine kinase